MQSSKKTFFSPAFSCIAVFFDLIPKSTAAASTSFSFDSSHLKHFLIQTRALIKNKGPLISKSWVSSPPAFECSLQQIMVNKCTKALPCAYAGQRSSKHRPSMPTTKGRDACGYDKWHWSLSALCFCVSFPPPRFLALLWHQSVANGETNNFRQVLIDD